MTSNVKKLSVTDRPTDRPTDRAGCRVAGTRLKKDPYRPLLSHNCRTLAFACILLHRIGASAVQTHLFDHVMIKHASKDLRSS